MKNTIRNKMLEKRRLLSSDYMNGAGIRALDIFLSSDLKVYSEFMIYNPVRNELPVDYIRDYLFAQGKNVSVPVIVSDESMRPSRIFKGCAEQEGRYCIPEPAIKNYVSPNDLEVVFVPGVAFNPHGCRVGYGKGYYDRFLAGLKALRIGVCYEFQILGENMGTGAHDVPMDYILTEKRIYEVNHAI
ncbi:MAG: 5-formyltetrahydrofolate cyclo-ligase [Clostridia bacterium]|nr:5-formyltetrahydrofolate cyclo-ligase [Clostridia bacterium]